MKKTVLILPDGCEEGEALTIADVLRRAAVECELCALQNRDVTGAWGNVIRADHVLTSMDAQADMIILPGGYKGAENMCADRQLQEMLQQMNREGKIIAAICAAPVVLETAGILSGKKATVHHNFTEELVSAEYVSQEVVSDGNVITAWGLGAAIPFGLAIVERCCGPQESDRIRKAIGYNH